MDEKQETGQTKQAKGSMETSIDPTNLSSLYFYCQDHEELNAKLDEEFVCYVNPNIRIENDKKNVVHGRGVVVTQDVKAGECLFVSSPVIGVRSEEARNAFLESAGSTLEETTMKLLQDKMMDAIRKQNNHGPINSFMALMGSQNGKQYTDTPSIDLLNGQDDSIVWSEEELNCMTPSNLKSIILKNAFGPEFITYDKIQTQWQSEESPNYSPPHLLGIYPLAAMLNHSCSPNAIRTYAKEGIMIVHACQPIRAGTEVVWSYIPTLQVFAVRRRALKQRHGFICRCERCLVEAKGLRKDILPANFKSALEDALKWNETLRQSDISNLSSSQAQISNAYKNLAETVFSTQNLSNEVKRCVRIGYTNLHFNFFNAILLKSAGDGSEEARRLQQPIREMILDSATQLHFAFCTSNNASTEHLSLLHLCYELIQAIHRYSSDKVKTQNQIKFWTDAMKRAHMIRYGEMGSDLEAVRNCLVHTRTILRQRDGHLKAKYNFL